MKKRFTALFRLTGRWDSGSGLKRSTVSGKGMWRFVCWWNKSVVTDSMFLDSISELSADKLSGTELTPGSRLLRNYACRSVNFHLLNSVCVRWYVLRSGVPSHSTAWLLHDLPPDFVKISQMGCGCGIRHKKSTRVPEELSAEGSWRFRSLAS